MGKNYSLRLLKVITLALPITLTNTYTFARSNTSDSFDSLKKTKRRNYDIEHTVKNNFTDIINKDNNELILESHNQGNYNLREREVELSSGDTFIGLLHKEQINDNVYNIATVIDPVYSLNKLPAGKKFTLLFEQSSNGAENFIGLRFIKEDGLELEVRKDFINNTFEIYEKDKRTFSVHIKQEITINDDFTTEAMKANVNNSYINQIENNILTKLDNSLTKGDKVSLLFSCDYLRASGDVVNCSDLLFTKVETKNNSYNFIPLNINGTTEFFSQSHLPEILNNDYVSPVDLDKSRMSSKFGYRIHPITKRSKLHRGMDYAAATGTPIYAISDATITQRGRFGGAGNMVVLQHDDETYKSRYMHMSRLADNQEIGSKVKKGDIIGYVGSTGASTGPHLHFEIHKNSNAIDPLSVAAFKNLIDSKNYSSQYASKTNDMHNLYAKAELKSDISNSYIIQLANLSEQKQKLQRHLARSFSIENIEINTRS